MRELVIATFNPKKGIEMQTILGASLAGTRLLTLADFPGAIEPEETGTTYAENAALKAVSASKETGHFAIADDAGLEIDALDGAPGLYSKRFGGEKLPFDQKIQRILAMLSDVPAESRTARFNCWIALSDPSGGPVKTFGATCEGVIANAPSGIGGFGYDPIFFLPELNCMMAELTAEEKHSISHRGKVLREFAEFWQQTAV